MAKEIIGENSFRRFKKGTRIGGGEEGIVFQVTEADTGLDYALKLPTPINDPMEAAALTRATTLQAQFSHPHITSVELLDTHRYRDTSLAVNLQVPFCVTPLAPTDLERYLETHGPLSLSAAVSLSGQLAEAVTTLHAAGVLYRDLTPKNILLHPTQTIVKAELTDFGIATPIADKHAEQYLGTPETAAPEQFTKPATPSVDQYGWAAGVVYPAFTGHVPHEMTNDEVIQMEGGTYVPPPRKPLTALVANPTPLIEAVDEVAARALQFNPKDRYPSMGSLLHDFYTKCEAAKGKPMKHAKHFM